MMLALSRSMPRPIVFSNLMVVLAMLTASIHPLDWSSYLLHQAGTLLFMALLGLIYRYWHLSNTAYLMSCGFIIIHIIGARYLYSYVPYDDWLQMGFDFRLAEVFGWQRNMYDRLVHFSYGLLLFSTMYQTLKYLLMIDNHRALLILTLMLNLSSSAVYELFEWAIAITLSPEAAEAYNGQQGDNWDAHKDMALALLGGMIAAVGYPIDKQG